MSSISTIAPALGGWTAIKLLLAALVFLVVLLMPAPEGLTEQGQRALAVMLLAVILWATEAIPVPVAGVGGVILLVLLGRYPASARPFTASPSRWPTS